MLVKPSRCKLDQRWRGAYAPSNNEDCVHTLGSVLGTVNRKLEHSAFMSTFFMALQPLVGQGHLIIGASRSHITLGRTPVDEWSARYRDLYLTINNNLKRQTSMLPAEFEPTIPANKRPQTDVLPRGRWDRLMSTLASQTHTWFPHWEIRSGSRSKQGYQLFVVLVRSTHRVWMHSLKEYFS
jgi:hypothetical protein